jgi:hypothetical protein
MLEKVREDYRESEVAERLAARDKQVMPKEHSDSVEDYDAVLRSHCRPDEPVPTTPK